MYRCERRCAILRLSSRFANGSESAVIKLRRTVRVFSGQILEFERFGFGCSEAIADFLAFRLYILERLPRFVQLISTPLGGFFVLLRNKATLGRRLCSPQNLFARFLPADAAPARAHKSHQVQCLRRRELLLNLVQRHFQL